MGRAIEEALHEGNPLVDVLSEKGMNASQLAVLSGVQRAWVSALVRGDAPKLSGRVLDALVRMGYDRDKMIGQYAVWRSDLAKSLEARYLGK